MSDWQRIQQLFLDAVDLPPRERARFLQAVEDPELIAELESLLAADNDSGAAIESAVQNEAAFLFDEQALIGERLGIYRIVREIGRGGMGSVYLALRDDSEYHKEVALKIVKRGMDTAEVLERFRHERQILANLEHPYIARLFDGGSTVEGVPFFVMEYVEGKPVDAFCRESALDIPARCELFIRILEAVAYAHRNLVVHRDLKPANILVAADGTPKLLDFGVAKLVSGDLGDDWTMSTTYRPFTPGYASPEQVRGLPITTATDIYSLGAILYELLIGRPAQKIEGHTPSEIERVVCDTEVPRPSLHQPGLSPDLDNIVLMATRKDPERRYQSADQFAEDIRSYLQGRPIVAHPDSLSYRAGKFIRRNRLQVALAAIVAASLVTGLIISLVQTHRAEVAKSAAESQRLIALHQTALAEAARLSESQQRTVADQQRALASQQRDFAEHQKTLAEQRVKDILELAGRTLFDVHDAIAPLPGSLAARRTILKTTLEYLETLQKQTGLDDEMREALCAAYYRVAMIQGDWGGASLQDFQGAEANLLKAETVLRPAYKRRPNDAGMMMRLIEVRSSLADLMYRSGRRQQSVQAYNELLPVAHRLSLVEPCTLNCKTQEPVIENRLATELMGIDAQRAAEHAAQGAALTRSLLVQHPSEPSLKQALGTLMASEAGAYRVLGDLEKAAEYYRQSIEAREALLAVNPNDSALQRNLLIAYGNYATVLGIPWSPNLNRPADARIYAAKAVALARKMVAEDEKNVTARYDLGMSLGRLGMIDPSPDATAESLATLQEAHSLIEPIVQANAQASETATQLANILEYEGHRQEALGKNEEAIESYKKSLAMIQPFLDPRNSTVYVQYLAGEESLALLYAASGDGAMALDLANRALSEAEKYSDQSPFTESQTATLAKAWSFLAATQSRIGRSEPARHSADNAMRLWKSIKKPGVLTAHRKVIAETQALLKPSPTH